MKIFKRDNSGMLNFMNVLFIIILLINIFIIYFLVTNTIFEGAKISCTYYIDYGLTFILAGISMVIANTKLNKIFSKNLPKTHLFINAALYFWLLISLSEAISNIVYLISREIEANYLNPAKGLFFYIGQIVIVGVVLYFLNKNRELKRKKAKEYL